MTRFQRHPWFLAIAALGAFVFFPAPAKSDDQVKLAVGAPGNWDTCVPEVGQRAGIFKKHGLTLELLYTQGGGETMQAVISGSVDIGVAAGTAAVMGAYAKGAPVRILAAGATGTSDLYWYVPTASPIKSTVGSSSLIASTRKASAESRPLINRSSGSETLTATITDVSGARPASISSRAISPAAARPI